MYRTKVIDQTSITSNNVIIFHSRAQFFSFFAQKAGMKRKSRVSKHANWLFLREKIAPIDYSSSPSICVQLYGGRSLIRMESR